MTGKIFTLFVVCIVAIGFMSQPVLVLGQQQDKSDEIKAKVQTRLANKKTSVVVEKSDGTKVKGRLTAADDTGFTVSDTKTGQSSRVLYSEARKLKGSGWPTSAKIALGVGAASAAALTILYIAFQNATRDN
ncbi:MAG TPA: hypothetical protein PKA82_00200 [Pyrinomonadaceae bacterium]|nr:hypothetical protein [Pyrinomonadaceae bacterium]